MRIVRAVTADHYVQARLLLDEYFHELALDLSFQRVEDEVAELEKQYGEPVGAFLLAESGSEVVGCVGVRPRDRSTCEMKRLYVRPSARSTRVGETLAEAAIQEGRRLGYGTMVLDTLPSMTRAQALYLSLGFEDCEPYYASPIAGTRYMRLDLTQALTAEEVAARIELLDKMPGAVADRVQQFDDAAMRTRAGDDPFTLLAHVCHLRDLEREAYNPRLVRLTEGGHPSLPDFNGQKVASERDYNSLRVDEALAELAAARARSVEIVRRSPLGALRRTGVLESVGVISANDLLSRMREHDTEHLADIDKLCARLSRGGCEHERRSQ